MKHKISSIVSFLCQKPGNWLWKVKKYLEKCLAIVTGRWQKIRTNEEGCFQLLILSTGMAEKFAVMSLFYGLFQEKDWVAVFFGIFFVFVAYVLAWRIRKWN